MHLPLTKYSKDFAGKKKAVREVIDAAAHILGELGVPIADYSPRALEKMAMAFLAVADVRKVADFQQAKSAKDKQPLKTRDVIAFMNENFGEDVSRGSYDDIRRKDLKLLVLGKIIVPSNPEAATNDPSRGYLLDDEYAEVIRKYGTEGWAQAVREITEARGTLNTLLSTTKDMAHVPVTLPDGVNLELTLGEHNVLQKAIIEVFLPRFGNGADVLYIGDTKEKFLYYNREGLTNIGFSELGHEKLPDVLAYSKDKNWLYLIEAVHSSGPISQPRIIELKKMTENYKGELVFVTAFLDEDVFKKFMKQLAWGTEVWLASVPDHLIHMNGHEKLAPHNG